MNFLPVIKNLVRAYQAFEGYSSTHIRSLGLTPVQFDVIATLANQKAMTFKLLGQKTLISKSSLTGVVDRMMQKGLVLSECNEDDARSQKLKLTNKGQKIFDKVFPEHLSHLKIAFDRLDPSELAKVEHSLQTINAIFNSPL